MSTAFTNWVDLSKHAGAMLMAPAILALGILSFSYFSWSKQMIEEASLLDVVMEIKVELERSHMYLHEMERDLILMRGLKGSPELLESINDKVLSSVDEITESMTNLNKYVTQTLEGTSTMGNVHLSQVETKRSVDDELIKQLEKLRTSVLSLTNYITPKLAGKEYQSFIYDSGNDMLFDDALESAQASDDRVHQIIKDKLDLQRRIFLLFIISFGALTAFVYYKWTQLSKEHTNLLTDLYFSSQTTEQCQDMVVVTDQRGIVDYANKSLLKNTGYQKHEIVGQKLAWLLTDDEAWSKEAITNISNNLNWQDDTEIKAKNGHMIKAQTRGYPILDKVKKPAFCVIRFKV